MPVNEALVHNWFFGNLGVRITGAIIFSYLLGSIPVRAVVVWLFEGLDSRLARVAAGAVPFVDGLKGFVATMIPLHGGGEIVGLASGFAATLGHYYTPWRRFKGDPSIGLLAGVIIAIKPIAAVISITFWIVVTMASNSSAAGTLFAAAMAFLPLWYFCGPLGALFGIISGTAVGLRVGTSCQAFECREVENLDRTSPASSNEPTFLQLE